jgi:hypothetical protein
MHDMVSTSRMRTIRSGPTSKRCERRACDWKFVKTVLFLCLTGLLVAACSDDQRSLTSPADASDAVDGDEADGTLPDVSDSLDSNRPLVPDAEEQELRVVDANESTDWEAGSSAAPAVTRPIAPRVMFREREAGEVSEHLISFDEDDFGFGYSAGGGLLDFDGDNDTDIFLGSNQSDGGSRPCIYENESTRDSLKFTCRHPLPIQRKMTGGWAIDVEGDGRDELLLLGANWVTIERFYPSRERMELLSLAEMDAQCTPASALITDYDRDGIADILLGCRLAGADNLSDFSRRNHLFRGTEDGGFEWVDPRPDPATFLDGLLAADTNTLALAHSDVNGDGLLDIHVINDTFSNEDSRKTNANPGGVYLSCRPDSPCRFRRVTYRRNLPAWGSFMAVSQVLVNELGTAYFIADWGPNRLLHWVGETFDEYAPERNLEMRGTREQFVFTWGGVAADFNFDGNDDLFVSQGSMRLGPPSEGERAEPAFFDQRDQLMVQDDTGMFHTFGSDVGIPLPARDPDSETAQPRASRALAFVDFNLDGVGEIFLLPYLGFSRILSTVSDEPYSRCTLIPKSRYIPVYGDGYLVRRNEESEFRSRQLQGHMQLGRPNAILVEGRSGELKFPSGAIVPWSCDYGDPVTTVVEPEWLGWAFEDGTLTVTIEEEFFDGVEQVTGFFRTSPSEPALKLALTASDGEEGVFAAPIADASAEFMLRIDDKFVGRWFDVLPDGQ